MEIKDLEHLLPLLKLNEITELEIEQADFKAKIVRSLPQVYISEVSQSLPSPTPVHGAALGIRSHDHSSHSLPAGSTVALQKAQDAAAVDPAHVRVIAPIVGTFYRRASPDADVFVKEGSRVSKGDTLCIIEAMKLMNPIEAENDGVVVKILGIDGKMVEYGETIFVIDPNA